MAVDWSEFEPVDTAPAGEVDWAQFTPVAPAKPVEGGLLASAKQTVGSTIKAVGQAAADFIPGVDADNAVKRYGQEVVEANPTATHSLSDIAARPGTAVAEAVGNAAPSMAGMVGARTIGTAITAASPLAGPAAPVVAAVGQAVSWFGPMAMAALPSFGSIRDKQILNDPENEASWKAKTAAVLGSAAVGAIETRFGPQEWALSAMTKEGRAQLAEKFAAVTLPGAIAKTAAKGAAIEGAEELVQNPIEQIAAGDDPTSKESLEDTAFGGAMGALGGGVLGGAVGGFSRRSPAASAKPILDAPDVDTAIEAFRASVTGTPVDTTAALVAATAEREKASGATRAAIAQQDLEQAQINRALNLGQVVQEDTGQFSVNVGDRSAPLNVWDEITPSVTGSSIPPEQVAAQREHYANLGFKAIYYEDNPLLPDGVHDASQPGVLFLSNDPSRNAAQVAAHELTHALDSQKLPDGRTAGELLNETIREGITDAGWQHALKMFSSTAPEMPAAGASVTEQKVWAASWERHMLNELGADIGGEAGRFETFMPKVVARIELKYGEATAKSFLSNFIASIKNAFETMKKFFVDTPAVSQTWVKNLEQVHDVLADMYARQYGTEIERQVAQRREEERAVSRQRDADFASATGQRASKEDAERSFIARESREKLGTIEAEKQEAISRANESNPTTANAMQIAFERAKIDAQRNPERKAKREAAQAAVKSQAAALRDAEIAHYMAVEKTEATKKAKANIELLQSADKRREDLEEIAAKRRDGKLLTGDDIMREKLGPIRAPADASPDLKAAFETVSKAPFLRTADEKVNVSEIEAGRRFAPKKDSAKLEAVRKGVVLNVGLNVGDEIGLTRLDVTSALKRIGVRVMSSDTHQSDTEQTMVAVLDRALTPDEAYALSVELKQEAIAQSVAGKGEIYGPQAENWRPFNPEFFLTPDGRRLSESQPAKPKSGEVSARTIRRLLQFLTPSEQKRITDRAAVKVLEHLKSLPRAEEFAAIAHAGRAKRGWYAGSEKAISAVFGPDAPRFASLLAALSPQTSVESNLRNALNVWRGWVDANRPTDREAIYQIMAENVEGSGTEKSVLDAWRNNSVRALTDDDPTGLDLSGPKVNSFFLNLAGNLMEVTNDTWMANFAGVSQTLFAGQRDKFNIGRKSLGYIAFNARVREAADRLTALTGDKWYPAEVQETIWSWAKATYEHANRAGETRSARELVMDDVVTHEMIASTPDFSTLFTDPEYRGILERAGYGEELRTLESAQRRNERQPGEDSESVSEASPFGRDAQKRYESRAAGRLDRLAARSRAQFSPKVGVDTGVTPGTESYPLSAARLTPPEVLVSKGKVRVLTDNERPVLERALMDVVKASAWLRPALGRVRAFAAHPAFASPYATEPSGSLAAFWPDTGTLSVREDILELAQRDTAAKQRLIGFVAHELGHQMDVIAGTGDAYRSDDSRMFRITGGYLNRRIQGSVVKEAFLAHERGDVLLSKFFNYPFRHLDDPYWSAKLLQQEVFAQLARLYTTNKPLMREGLPDAYRLFQQIESYGWTAEVAAGLPGVRDPLQDQRTQVGDDDADGGGIAVSGPGGTVERTADRGSNLARVVANSKLLPDGQLTGTEWRAHAQLREMLGTSTVDLEPEKLYYKDEVARHITPETLGNTADVSVRMSPKAYSPDDARGWKIQRVPPIDTANGKGLWNVVDVTGEAIDAFDTRRDAQGYLERARSQQLKAALGDMQIARKEDYDQATEPFPEGMEYAVAHPTMGTLAWFKTTAEAVEWARQENEFLRSQPPAEDERSLSPKSPEFLKWFGDSKVVDANGEPLVVYHGTNAKFNTFDPAKIGVRDAGFFGSGIYATPDLAEAEAYAEGAVDDTGEGAVVSMPLYMSIQNPFYWDVSSPAAVAKTRAALGLFGIEGVNLSGMGNLANNADRRKFNSAVRSAGHDGVLVVRNGAAGLDEVTPVVAEAVVFRPEQVKSVFNERPTDSPDISQSPKIVGESKRVYTPAQRKMFQNLGRTVEVPSFRNRVAALRKDFAKKMAQGLFDQFAPLKELSSMAYLQARLSKGSAGAFEAVLHHGKLLIRDGVFDADRSGGFIETVGVPLQGELEDFFWWVAGNRAEKLSAQDRERLFSASDITAAKDLANGTLTFDYTMRNGTTTRNRAEAFKDTLAKFEAFNKNILDMAEQSGLIEASSRQYWEDEFYVPFYRVSEEDGAFIGGNIGNGLVRQRAFRKLKGGEQKLNSDLLQNVLSNWNHLIDASAKNRASKSALEAAERMGVAVEAPAATVKQMGKSIGRNGVWFMDGGVQRHFLVDDPFVLAAITSLEFAGFKNPVMDAMTTFKHVLTVGVTASPIFKVKNLIRDSVQAIATADMSYNIPSNIRKGLAASDHTTQTYVSALASGGLIRFGTMIEGKAADRARQLVKAGIKDTTILNSDSKFRALYDKLIDPAVAAYNELGNRSEEINRASLYKQLTEKGMDHATASLMARDLMDFSLQGAWSGVRFLSQVVPFFNARMQGMYKLGRSAKEDPKRIAVVIGAMAVFSIALMAAYSDDDDWKKREDWDRDNYWWFKIGGIAYRIPKPFEIGAVASLAERGLEYFTSKEMTGTRFRKVTMDLISNNLSMNPTPQVFKPLIDVYANKDSFTGRPLESMGMENLRPDYRFNGRTSMVARAAGTAGQAVTGLVGADFVSPIKIDHMIRGYFGWLGSFAVGTSELLARPLSGQPGRPEADLWRVATQGLITELPTDQSRYVSQMYEQARVVEEAYGTYRSLLKQGDAAGAREFLEANRLDIVRYKSLETVKRTEAKLNERIRMIERSSRSPEEKRLAIQAISVQKDRAARLVN